LIATHNQAKLQRYQHLLGGIDDLELVSLRDMNITDKVDEDQPTSIGNATKKAKFYGDLSGLITIGIDEALMTNFLPDGQQPGVYARRFSGDKRELSDPEVIEVWQKIFAEYPNIEKKFIWDFAIVFYNPITKDIGNTKVEQISYALDTVSDVMQPGYPMSSFMSSRKNGKAYSEMSESEHIAADLENFDDFVKIFRVWLAEQR
ncbi:hypothetical protein HGB24_01045, partial [Candidatus Saccharibacteria bacterium]|nr:hypothetical protein [Candidatus Saccharibacteria bacterium]